MEEVEVIWENHLIRVLQILPYLGLSSKQQIKAFPLGHSLYPPTMLFGYVFYYGKAQALSLIHI